MPVTFTEASIKIAGQEEPVHGYITEAGLNYRAVYVFPKQVQGECFISMTTGEPLATLYGEDQARQFIEALVGIAERHQFSWTMEYARLREIVQSGDVAKEIHYAYVEAKGEGEEEAVDEEEDAEDQLFALLASYTERATKYRTLSDVTAPTSATQAETRLGDIDESDLIHLLDLLAQYVAPENDVLAGKLQEFLTVYQTVML